MSLNTDPFPMIHHSPPVKTPLAASAGTYLQMFFLVYALGMVLFHARTESFTTFSIIFSSIVLEAMPFMLLGTLVGGLVEVFISRDQLLRFLPKHRLGAIAVAACLGLIFPVCECAVVPVVRKFIQKGMPLGAAVAFLLGGPIANPLVFGSTLVAYSFSIETACIRVMEGIAIAMSVGWFIDTLIEPRKALLQQNQHLDCGCSHGACHHVPIDASFGKKIRSAVSHATVDFYDIGRFLVMGAFLAAALQTLISRQAVLSVADGPFLAIFAMMILAVILNLCSEADAFIAASFKPLGMPFSAQMAFMVLGPMLDIKLIMMYLGVFTRRMIITLVISVFLTVFLAMAALEVFQWFTV